MGNSNGKSSSKVGKPAKLSAKDEEFLPKRTGLSRAQVQKFFHQFNEDNPDGLLDRNEFNKLYQSLHTVPVQDLDEIQDTVFKAFESDKITFREFMLAFSMATFHSEEDVKTQLEYVFLTYDTDASGYLDLNETKELALTGWNLMRPLTLRKTNVEDIDDLAAKYFEKLDTNTDGKVSIDEFVSGLDKLLTNAGIHYLIKNVKNKMALLNELFGVNNVRNKNGDIVDLVDQCTGKSIGIFFSANWCGACQYFTPVLAKFYRKYAKTKNIEILFVSSDENQQSFDKYYAEMPWLALDYNDRDRRVYLTEKYHVKNLPRLVIIDSETTDVLNNNAKIVIGEDEMHPEILWTFEYE